ncbi:MAG TPA: M20/M25/M40 family metallo-hydrolase [Ktedonobacteraceae bacterium]|nr:M20/M25/M40 family metallo-hydrolase [Ktedonobacteraceae bacterium]
MSLTSPELSQLQAAARGYTERVVELAQSICLIPAPTGSERQRAEFVAALWQERGYTPEIDAIGNVYVRRGKRENVPLLMLLAHTDTVFPASVPITVRREGDILRGPGIGDNSLSVAAMISVLELFDALEVETDGDIIAVANVGEEGLGNLRGARAAVERYRHELGAVIALDGSLGQIVHSAVGSRRWRVTVRGPGGHSFGSFGMPSAIHGLGKIIAAIAALEVPREPKTTYNVGVIEGGTSINTIAPHASALLDMRSTDIAALDRLCEQVRTIIAHSAGEGLSTEIEVLGERPAGQQSQSEPLVQLAARILKSLGVEPRYAAASTDANIPISLHIPALCVGITQVKQTHTISEWIAIPPIGTGLAQIVQLCVEASALAASGKDRVQ